MAIKLCEKMGFCSGVRNSIKMAKAIRIEHKQTPIHVIGYIVHNQHVIDELKEFDIVTLDDREKTRMELVEEVKEGIVIFTAHGTDHKVIKRAIEKGLKVYDTTCPMVNTVENKIKDAILKGKKVLYIGVDGHPETIAALSIDDEIRLIQSTFDLQALHKEEEYYATNQTTLSLLDVEDIYDKLEKEFKCEIDNQICLATTERQESVKNLYGISLVVVVGDERSNNAKKLVDVAKHKGHREAILVSKPEDLDRDLILRHRGKIAVTAGASTPEAVIKAVCDQIEEHCVLSSY